MVSNLTRASAEEALEQAERLQSQSKYMEALERLTTVCMWLAEGYAPTPRMREIIKGMDLEMHGLR